jgi:hypothetical protein
MISSPGSETCSLTQCASCTGSVAVYKLFSALDSYEFGGDEITCRQWVTTDCSTLMTVAVPCEELTDEILNSFHPQFCSLTPG